MDRRPVSRINSFVFIKCFTYRRFLFSFFCHSYTSIWEFHKWQTIASCYKHLISTSCVYNFINAVAPILLKMLKCTHKQCKATFFSQHDYRNYLRNWRACTAHLDVARRTIIIAVYSPINTILMLQRAYFKVLFTTCVCILIF